MTEQIFISYSRQDSHIVEQITKDFESAGLDVWLDKDDLVPGTHNWEQAIRDAIENASAVVLVASPHSRQSTYVQGEIALAQSRNRPIYPLWVQGDQWIDCIQIGMVNYQHIDCRDNKYTDGVATSINILQEFQKEDGLTITLGLPTHETIEVSLQSFDGVGDFLNHIYMMYLFQWYEPFTYGSEWVLANVKTKEIAVPWSWLENRNQPIATSLDAVTSFDDFNIQRKDYWAVWEAKRIRAAGIAVNDTEIQKRLLSSFGQRDLWLLRDEDTLKVRQLDEVDPEAYQHAFVLALFNTGADRFALVERT